MHIGRRIYVYRRKNNYTLKDLSNSVYSISQVSRVENEHNQPNEEFLRSIAPTLEVPPDFLLNHSNEDIELQYLLLQMQSSIILNMERAEELIEMIEESYFQYLQPIKMEIFYLLLKGAFLYKKERYEEAEYIYDTYLQYYLDGVNPGYLSSPLEEAHHYFQGAKNYYNRNFNASLEHFERFNRLSDAPSIRAAISYNMALIHRGINNYQNAINYTHTALQNYKNLNKPFDECRSHNLLGSLYGEIDLYDEAAKELEQAKEKALKNNYTSLLGRIYHNYGMVLSDTERIEEAIVNFKESIKHKDTASLLITYRSLIECLLKTNKTTEANNLFLKASSYSTRDDDYFKLLTSFIDYYLQMENDEDFIKSIRKAMEYFEESEQYRHLRGLATKLGDYYYNKGKYKQAAHFYKYDLKLFSGNY
ncbi:helix-turn-helix transcriptional regulator [Thalassobacillus sp. CUG 92003]|uniref:helix-turn-helix domain-containing protein n=1 Tax=Thalassobacillus sp. CUG 92003 TaxID=2736641 RepID=UPI0015E6678D|nr:helix-turn-helix transcriptional regulator [Thalassobacillus sp. CUG 92003]